MLVTEIQRFCMHDGPGIRTVVFLSGCPLRCVWCHNPETQRTSPTLQYSPARCISCAACSSVCPGRVHGFDGAHTLDRAGCTDCGRCTDICPTGALSMSAKDMTAAEILAEVERDRVFYGPQGGITLSGGEPLMHGENALTLLKLCKDAGLHTAVETCGVFDPALLPSLVPLVDLFLWDVKDTDPARHRRNTGAALETVLDNLHAADALGAATRLRCIMVNGENANEAHIRALASLYRTLHHCEGVQLLPCHMYSSGKYNQLGRTCALPDSAACPPELLEKLQAALDAECQQ